MNMLGFTGLSLCFLALALVFRLAPDMHNLAFALLIVTNAFLNFGPNLGTYVLPAICFPAAVRSTCHGISAFGGKFGAAVGTLMFVPIMDKFGPECVMWIELAVSILGMLVSFAFLKNDWEYLQGDDFEAVKSYIEGTSNVGHGA